MVENKTKTTLSSVGAKYGYSSKLAESMGHGAWSRGQSAFGNRQSEWVNFKLRRLKKQETSKKIQAGSWQSAIAKGDSSEDLPYRKAVD